MAVIQAHVINTWQRSHASHEALSIYLLGALAPCEGRCAHSIREFASQLLLQRWRYPYPFWKGNTRSEMRDPVLSPIWDRNTCRLAPPTRGSGFMSGVLELVSEKPTGTCAVTTVEMRDHDGNGSKFDIVLYGMSIR